MQENEIINSVRRKLTNSSFSGQTYSKKGLGFKINFESPNIMNVRGGNLGLPDFAFLRLSEKVSYAFDEDRYIDRKKIYSKDVLGVLDKLERIKRSQKGLDTNWQILRLLDPRILLKNGNYKIWGIESLKEFDKITIEYDISRLSADNMLKISDEFVEWLISENLEKRTALVYVNQNHYLDKISQKEILPPTEDVLIKFHYAKRFVTREKPIPVPSL